MVLQDMSLTLVVSVLVTASVSAGFILVVLLCVPCLRKKRGFTNFHESTTSLDSDQGEINNSFTLSIDDGSGGVSRSTVVTIEPLPDIASRLKQFSTPLRPRITCVGSARQDASLKLTAVHHPFPRNQIVYLKELGTGWFGKVIESDAEKITLGVPRTKVVVKMLKDDATREEKFHFFEEVAPFRLLEHNNVMRLLGQCTETTPLLVILEAAAYGNLKQYLRSHRHSEALLIQKNRLMQFAVDVSCGLACLHRHDYLHRDLAARNCLVMGDFTLKIGDYGIADTLFKEDYFPCGPHLLPIRWMAPETLKQDNGSWAVHTFSKFSDIWSLGVVLWEIATMGEQPYGILSDDDVLQKVVMGRHVQLTEPQLQMPHKDRLYEVMRCCWMSSAQRIQVDEVHRLLQTITRVSPLEAASGDAMSAFDQKWAELMPNQHHWSADSIDSQLASASRGDASFISECSQPNSFEDLTAPELQQSRSPVTTAIVHASAGGGVLMDMQQGTEDSIRPAGLPVTGREASPVFLSPITADTMSAPCHTDSPALPTSHSGASLKDSDSGLVNDPTEVFAVESDLTVNGHLASGSENDSSGFDVLESAADFDLAEDKSVSDSVGTCQSSVTGDASIEKDSSSCEFVVVSDFKDSPALTPTTEPAMLSGSASVMLSEKFILSDTSHSSVSELHNDKPSAMTETCGQQDTDTFVSFGTELSSLSSLTVQAPAGADKEQHFPSFDTDLSSLSSLTVLSPEPHITSPTCDTTTLPSSDNTAFVYTDGNQNSSSLQGLNDIHFDTLNSLSGVDSQTPATGKQGLPVKNRDGGPDLIEVVNASDSQSRHLGQDHRAELGSASTIVSGGQVIPQRRPAGLENGETVSEDSVSNSSDNAVDKGRDHIPKISTDVAVSPDTGASDGLSLKASLSEDTLDSSVTHINSDEVLQHSVSASPETLPSVSGGECLGATGGVSTDESYTDSDSSTNSDSGKDYICEEGWEDQGECPPPSSSPTDSMDSEEYALQLASEIYLSKGLKMGRPFESTFLEPIPEDPIPSISEESVAPAPSDSSSVDVKFDEVFEWDDFMGEPLVGKEPTSSDGGSPKESFDMSDWMLDMDSDSLPSASSSLASQHSDTLRKESAASDFKSTGTPDSAYTRSSSSDNELTSHGRSRNHRSYISDLLSNRTKGVSSTSSHYSGHSKFYSLYEEDFDLESDSQSEGGGSPPPSGFLTGFQEAEPQSTGVLCLQGADSRTSHASAQGVQDDGVATGSSEEWDECDDPPLD